MIKNNEALSIAETKGYIKTKSNETDLLGFIKKFTKLNVKEAKEFRKKLEELNLMKMKSEHIIKIIDLMPENKEDLNKIFIDIGLNEDETKKILETIKEFK